jgi:SAM-dependent methyltransferase
LPNIENEQEGLRWQLGVWDRMSPIYLREVDNRFTEIVDGVIRRGALRAGQQVLNLGTGTGSVAVKAASLIGSRGHVTALDISPEMLGIARRRSAGLGLSNITFLEGRAEELPVHSGRFDAVSASLSLMYVIDRATAAREIARVLGPGGRLVAAVWSALELSQKFRRIRERSGTDTVTTAQLPSERQEEARAAVRARMWPMGDGARQFKNVTHFITGAR